MTQTRTPYAMAIFANAFLLFLVQPMIAKAATPIFGGTASVWNSALLVGQLLLLTGTIYASTFIGKLHQTHARFLHQIVVYAIILATIITPNYISSGPSANLPFEGMPEIRVPIMMIATVGLAMFMLAASGPILQDTYARSAHNDNPYPLYAWSNAGSLLGLLAYPLLLEPLTGTETQIKLWKAAAMVVLAATTWILLWGKLKTREKTKHKAIPLERGHITKWMAYAGVVTLIMMTTGQVISTDIMSMPLLWIFPLGAFLIGYIWAFRETPPSVLETATKAPHVGLTILAIISVVPTGNAGPIMAILAISSIALVTYGIMRRAYESRPDTSNLGKFYLALAAGGIMGGFLSAVIAPSAFNWRWEMPIAIIAAAYLLKEQMLPGGIPRKALFLIFGIAIVGGVIGIIVQGAGNLKMPQNIGVILVCSAACIIAAGNRAAFTGWIIWLLIATGLTSIVLDSINGRLSRSYYAIHSIETDSIGYIPVRALASGTTIHGMQQLGMPETPTTYYTKTSGAGDIMRAIEARNKMPDIAVIGLGIGTLSCLAPDKAKMTYFEVDPEVVKIARTKFRTLRTCSPNAAVITGDGRLELSKLTSQQDAIIVDAFSSDAIPMHLITAEALDNYTQKLKAGGYLLIHISNRHLDIGKPIAAWAQTKGYQTHTLFDDGKDALTTSSKWLVVRPDGWKEKEGDWTADKRWELLTTKSKPWTDDRSSILGILSATKGF